MRLQHWTWVGIITAAAGYAPCGDAQEKPAGSEPKPAPAPRARLDLRPPDVTELFSQDTLNRILSATRDPDTLEEVEVEGRRGLPEPRTPDVPGGILAPFWAFARPTQAWRILAPLTPDQTKGLDVPLDATDPYRPPGLAPEMRLRPAAPR
jgi:hypothetical protein